MASLKGEKYKREMHIKKWAEGEVNSLLHHETRQMYEEIH